mmetsp:Transcript_14653/g.22288  ORF Transcript_14653/g.22288 Transcript_14653/m.22288 type:complete len:205 (-) Transcript_14653:265-879(-)
MAQCDGSTLGIHLLHRNVQVLHRHCRLRSKCFVDLVDVDVVHLQACFVQSRRNRISRADTHDLGVDSDHSEAAHPGENRQAQLLGSAATSQEHQGSTVRDLTCVASSCGTSLLEGCLQLGETLEVGLRSGALVGFNDHLRRLAIFVLDGRCYRNNLRIEEPLLLRSHCLGMRADGHLVLGLARNLPLLSHILRGDAHRDHASRC